MFVSLPCRLLALDSEVGLVLLVPSIKVLYANVQETLCATPVQADIFVPELQQQQARAQPSIPNDIAASQAAPADIALPKDHLNPSFHDPQQPSLVVVTPDQLFERPVCDSQQAGTLVIMQQPDSSLTNQMQTSTTPVSADDSPAMARAVALADGNAVALPSNGSKALVNCPSGPGVSSISKPPEAAQIKGSPATHAAAAAAMASEQQSPPAEPTATGLVSSAQPNSNFGSSAMPTSRKWCAALPTGIVVVTDKPASSQGGFKGSLLGPLTTAEAAHVAEIAGSTDELRRVRTTQLFPASASAA